MRIWALDFRRIVGVEKKRICLVTAISFRDGPCYHEPEPVAQMCVRCAKDFDDCTCKLHYHRAF